MTMRVGVRLEADGTAARAAILSVGQAAGALADAAVKATGATTGAAAGIDAIGRAAAAANTTARQFATEIDRAARAIDRDFGGAFGSAAASASAFEAAIEEVGADFSVLEAQLNPAIRALREFEAVQVTVARAVAAGAVTQDRASAVLAQAAARQAQATGVAAQNSGRLGLVAQQAGFQIADFAVQVQGGVNPLIALSQQGSQVLGVFGVWGAVFGAALAIAGGVATAIFALGDEAENTADRAELLNTAISDFRSAAVTNAAGVQALIENYGALDAQLISTIQLQTQLNLDISRGAARKQLGSIGSGLQDEFADLTRNVSRSRGGVENLDLSDAAEALGIGASETRIVRSRLLGVQEAGTLAEQTAALTELGKALEAVVGPNPTEQMTAFRSEIVATRLALTQLSLDERTAQTSQSLLARPIPELNALAATVGAPKGRGRSGERARDAELKRSDRVLVDLAAEVQANERLAAAKLMSADAVREALVAEAQEQALRRAGLELADLAGGADQARARQIAGLTAQLYDQNAAQAAAGEVAQAYADIAGTSYATASAEIDRWRQATLLALEDVGAGHADLAVQVAAIAADRLREAYAADLAARTDWQAGVERGLNTILDEHRSLADEVEDLVGTMSSSVEDAFVQMATTGKIQTSDLVEFALRQFFRLAQQAAISFATGGDGGVLGQIFSGLLGAVGGAFGGSVVGPAGSGVLGGSGMFASAHTGGMVADAPLTHRLDAAVFAGAPRLHGGGLLPGERPAILLDDERVLTAAQQQSTAETITGLAALVRSGQTGAPAGQMSVTVNIHGAPGEAKVSQRQTEDGLTIDVLLEAVDGHLAKNAAAGRGQFVQVLGQRFQVRPTGGF